MHSQTLSVTPARCLPHGVLRTLCGFLALLSLYGGAVSASDQKKLPETPLSAKAVDSYTITERGDGYRVNISYPQVGNPVADAELAIWAREQAAAFTDSVRMIPTAPPVPYELSISYETLRASSRVISVIFFISTFMGGAHPEPGLATFVYDRLDGRRLSYGDLFKTQENIAQTLSAICREALASQLGERIVTDMLEAGTAPDMTNFDLFALAPGGVRVYFPPYQAAPYAEGYLNVTVSLNELAAFKPHMAFWDRP